jgi:hypothetical protein
MKLYRNKIFYIGMLFCLWCGSALANINTFTGIGGSVSGPGTYTEDGITATSLSGTFWGWPDPGQVHLDPSGFAGNTVDFTFSSGLFDLKSLDISYASSEAIGTLTAFDALNAPIFTQAIDASVLGTVNFSGWNGISSLRLVDTVSHLSVDNLVLFTSAVPEPETYAMLMAGLGLMGFVARRRKENQA